MFCERVLHLLKTSLYCVMEKFNWRLFTKKKKTFLQRIRIFFSLSRLLFFRRISSCFCELDLEFMDFWSFWSLKSDDTLYFYVHYYFVQRLPVIFKEPFFLKVQLIQTSLKALFSKNFAAFYIFSFATMKSIKIEIWHISSLRDTLSIRHKVRTICYILCHMTFDSFWSRSPNLHYFSTKKAEYKNSDEKCSVSHIKTIPIS